MAPEERVRFIADHNVGKLAKWLRMMGYDTLFFTGEDDWEMVIKALRENRILLTRDTGIMKMGVVTSGRVRAILIESDRSEEQLRQVNSEVPLDDSRFLTLCLECNRMLEERTKEQVKDRVPPYVFKTQEHYMECPSCHRIYWKGTHWQSMASRLEKALKEKEAD